MPRIDPQQLLNCLQVLLTPEGGILSEDEVQRLANLMTKFSKKLVSKCIYVLILKNTAKSLLGLFMAEGGWNLIHIWLQDANHTKNWALVSQLLELLLIAPVDVERLKMNNLPKLVKSITKRDDLVGIQQLASSLVEEWLKIVKDVTKAEAIQVAQQELNDTKMEVEESTPELDSSANEETVVDNSLKFKVAVRDGKNVISKITNSNEENVPDNIPNSISNNIEEDKEKKEKDDKKKEKSNHERSRHRSSSSSSSSKGSRKEDSSRSRDKSRHSSSKSSSSSRDRDKKDKHKNNGSSKHRSNSSSKSTSNKDKDNKDKKETNEKQAEKDKDTLAKLAPPTLQKLGRIPRKASEEKPKDTKDPKKEEKTAKKPTFSVEVRKDNEEKPKTVKVFNSKMRSTGLLEEAKPPPSRAAITKKPAPAILSPMTTKRPSPIRDIIPPPEKKSRLLDPDRPGAIKLIPPKPKPAFLQESDLFMDALTASATAKKEPKKRKRRASTSKESSSPPGSPNSNTPSSPLASPTGSKSLTPTANFYQDTLETAENEEPEVEKKPEETKMEVTEIPAEPEKIPEEPVFETTRVDANGLRGVLSHAKRKGPKRVLRWRAEPDLVEIQYFELDETERINVMKSFGDAARMEMSGEREMLRARKLPNEDVMDTQMNWRLMMEIDLPPPQAEPGCKSLEKDIQFAREKRILQSLFFPNKIPESPLEPDNENHPMTDPIPMPLEDADNLSQDTPTQPWPEPKGSPPHVPSMPNIFPNLSAPPFMGMVGPPNNFPPVLAPFGPGFLPPMIGPTGLLANGLPPSMPPPDMMKFDPPPMYPPPDTFGPPNMSENGFAPPPFNPPNMGGMYPPNFNHMRGGRGFRRGGNNMNGPWVRMSGNNQSGGWNGRGGGGPNRGSGGRMCINIKKHGYCRNRDNCNYMH